jgi:hypothetical protein
LKLPGKFFIILSNIFFQKPVYPFSSCCQLMAGKPEGKRPLGRPRRRWVKGAQNGWGDWMGEGKFDSVGSG